MNVNDFRLNHGVYFSVLAIAFGTWVMAAVSSPPPYTRWFFLFIMLTFAIEYSTTFWKKELEAKGQYTPIKLAQRFVLILVIFLLSDGDVVDLSVGAFLAVIVLVVRPQLESDATEIDKKLNREQKIRKLNTWDWIARIDEVILGYLIGFQVHAVRQYGFEFLTTPRLLLLFGFTAHYVLVVFRETRDLEPGCSLDKYNALGMVSYWALIPIYNAIMR